MFQQVGGKKIMEEASPVGAHMVDLGLQAGELSSLVIIFFEIFLHQREII